MGQRDVIGMTQIMAVHPGRLKTGVKWGRRR